MNTSEITFLNVPTLESLGQIPKTYGSVRRKLIIELMESRPDLYVVVNRKHTAQLKQDPDLRKLLKSGKLKRVRLGSSHSRQTYLVLNK